MDAEQALLAVANLALFISALRRFFRSIRRLDVRALGELNRRGHVVGEEFSVALRAHRLRHDADLPEFHL